MPDRDPHEGVHLYLDSADREVCEPLLRTGLFAGLTTNPTILQRAGLGVESMPDVFRWATVAGAPSVFLQTWGDDVDALVTRGCELRDLGPQVVIKVVASTAGMAACLELHRREIPTLLTAVYTPAQALMAAAAHADFIAPYLGKLNEADLDGRAVVEEMQLALRGTATSTEILLASIREPYDVVDGARAGIHHFTMNPSVAQAMCASELTDNAAAAFNDAIAATAITVDAPSLPSASQGE